jgi:hypothetical protein
MARHRARHAHLGRGARRRQSQDQGAEARSSSPWAAPPAS